MFKITELKKAIKDNNIRDMFYVEGFTKTLFNYKNKLVIDLKGIDTQKLYDFLKSQKMCNDEYQIDKFYHDNKFLDTFNNLKNSHNKNNKHLLLDTTIEFTNNNINNRNKVIYKVFKSSAGLLKIDIDLLSFLDLKQVVLYTNDNNDACYIYNNTNDYIGLCIIEKFDSSELLELLAIPE